MSRIMSSFVLSVQRKFNDYSAYTESLIYERTNERILDFESKYNWPSLRSSTQFYNTANDGTKNMSTVSGLRVSGIHKLYDDANAVMLKQMSLDRYLELGLTEDTAQYATHYIPMNDDTIELYPIPSSSSTYTMYYTKRHPYMSAAAMYFHLADDEVDVVKAGVIADIYEDKDDNRLAIYESRYQQGIKQRKRSQKMGEEQNKRFLPGDSLE